MADETVTVAKETPARPPGEAAIKEEFLLPVVRPSRNGADSKGPTAADGNQEEPERKRAKLDAGDDHQGRDAVQESASNGQQADRRQRKKDKAKGMNKQRSGPQRTPPGEKLCPVLKDVLEGEPEVKCTFQGARGACHFLHDVQKYVAEKPADLGEKCYMFTEHGRCPSGLTCRFSSSHVTPDWRNRLGDSGQWQTYLDSRPARNLLAKTLQRRLWKRQYDFSRANDAVNRFDTRPLREGDARGRGARQGRKPAVNGAEKVSEGGGDGVENVADEKSAEITEATAEKSAESPAASCSGGGDDSKPEASTAAAEDVAPPGPEAVTSPAEEKPLGPVSDADLVPLRQLEKKKICWVDQLYLAPLTTVGNLPFRRLCKRLGADITCGEMAMASNLLQGSQAEWALVRRHHTETVFGAQICGNNPGVLTRCAQLLNEQCELDFIDINMGCPIDMVYEMGAGSALMRKRSLLENACRSIASVIDVPLTLKMRTGVQRGVNLAKPLLTAAHHWGVDMCTLHGRSREQRYTKLADWSYVAECAQAAAPMPLFGNGDVLSWEEYESKKAASGVAGVMVARGALIKPWIFTEIKERRTWDISSSERLEILKEYANYGLEHWGSDTEGVSKTRRFMLEWLSFLYRYVPAGVLVAPPQQINERPPAYRGRDQLETLMASPDCRDWVKISEMVLGRVPDDFEFVPKHKANSYS